MSAGRSWIPAASSGFPVAGSTLRTTMALSLVAPKIWLPLIPGPATRQLDARWWSRPARPWSKGVRASSLKTRSVVCSQVIVAPPLYGVFFR